MSHIHYTLEQLRHSIMHKTWKTIHVYSKRAAESAAHLSNGLSLPVFLLTNLGMTLILASFSQHLRCAVVSVQRPHVWCRSRNKLNFIRTAFFKVSQMSCLAFLCRAAEMHLFLSPGFARRFMSSGRRSQVFFRFVFQLSHFGVGFAVSSAQWFSKWDSL